jgi:hypothetical protein
MRGNISKRKDGVLYDDTYLKTKIRALDETALRCEELLETVTPEDVGVNHAHYCEGVYGEKTVLDISDASAYNGAYSKYVGNGIAFVLGEKYAVNWGGSIHICTAKKTTSEDEVYSICNEDADVGDDDYFAIHWEVGSPGCYVSFYKAAEYCEVMQYSENVKQLDPKYIPDYASKTYVDDPFDEVDEMLTFVLNGTHVAAPGTYDTYLTIMGSYQKTGVSICEVLTDKSNTEFTITWGDEVYNLTRENVSGNYRNAHILFPGRTNMSLALSEDDVSGDFRFVTESLEETIEPMTLTISGIRTGGKTRNVKTERIPGYVSKTEVKQMIANSAVPLRAFVRILGGEENWQYERIYNDYGVEIGQRFGQVVEVIGAEITEYSKVDLQITSEQMVIFFEEDLAFVAENDNGVITVYCVGGIPKSDYTLQATVTEVVIDA